MSSSNIIPFTAKRRSVLKGAAASLATAFMKPFTALARPVRSPLEMIQPFCAVNDPVRSFLESVNLMPGAWLATDGRTAVRVRDASLQLPDAPPVVHEESLRWNLARSAETMPWTAGGEEFTLEPWTHVPDTVPCKACAEIVTRIPYHRCDPECDGTSINKVAAVLDWMPEVHWYYDLLRLQRIVRELPGVVFRIPTAADIESWLDDDKWHKLHPLPFRWAHGDGLLMPIFRHHDGFTEYTFQRLTRGGVKAPV